MRDLLEDYFAPRKICCRFGCGGGKTASSFWRSPCLMKQVVPVIPDADILIVPPSTPTRIRFKKPASRTRSCVHVLVLSGCCIAHEFRRRRRHQWLMQGSCIPQSDGPRVGTASLRSSSMKNQSSHEEAESRRGDIWQQARRPLAIDFIVIAVQFT